MPELRQALQTNGSDQHPESREIKNIMCTTPFNLCFNLADIWTIRYTKMKHGAIKVNAYAKNSLENVEIVRVVEELYRGF